ncbi:MAG: hypothetical protein KIT25_03855 [Enhydrobacter sp.]|nr:MAG: hypothetical protein KIT25_03855 [Enhydrobacter sp.]
MTPQERLDEMLENKRNAQKAFMDRADGAAPAEKDRLRVNWETAEQNLVAAQTNGLTKTSAELDDAVGKLATANTEAKAALAAVMQISELLKKLEKATTLAGKVLLAAV